MHEIRPSLITYTRTPTENGQIRVSYFVGDLMIMTIDVLPDFVPGTGKVDEILLTQLLVTPHQHLALLGDIRALLLSQDLDGPWKDILTQIDQLLLPPDDVQISSSDRG